MSSKLSFLLFSSVSCVGREYAPLLLLVVMFVGRMGWCFSCDLKTRPVIDRYRSPTRRRFYFYFLYVVCFFVFVLCFCCGLVFLRVCCSVKMFRPDENAKRIQASASRILMEPPPAELFIKACKMAVNVSFEFCFCCCCTASNDKKEKGET